MFSLNAIPAFRLALPVFGLLLLWAGVATDSRAQTGFEPSFSHEAGLHENALDLLIETTISGAVVRYTLDGSEPAIDSPAVEGPLRITDRSSDPNVLSMIRTSSNWQPPAGSVPKATVIRAAVFHSDSLLSDVVTRTFFVGEAQHRRDLPLISLVTDAGHFFDHEEGIYVPGQVFEYEFDASREWWQHPGNYSMRGRDWERPVHMEVFEPGEGAVAALNAGVRIHGGATRTYRGKALRLYFRSDYDDQNRLDHPIFPDQDRTDFKRLILRMSGNDAAHSLFRDVLIQRLAARMGIDTQDARTAVVYVNGEFWGVHHVRERFDDRYIENVYGVDRDRVDMLELDASTEYGSADHYLALLDFIRESDMSTSDAGEELETRMDADDFFAYQISQIFFDNTDWPHNNIRYWRKQTNGFVPDAPHGHDGRWRWLLYDTDFGFGLYGRSPAANTLSHARQDGWATELFRATLSNAQLRDRFLNAFADHLNTTFQPDLVISVLDSLEAHLEQAMPAHIARWRWPASTFTWSNEINNMRSWASQRPAHVWEHLRAHFELETTSVSIAAEGGGSVRVNSIDVHSPEMTGYADGGSESGSFVGQYFAGVPIRLTASPAPGHVFSGWDGIDDSAESVAVDPRAASRVVAVFLREGPPVPTPHALADGDWTLPAWSPAEEPGTYPSNMIFRQSRAVDPGLDAEMHDPYILPYDLEQRTRIVGLADGGFAFINTGANDLWAEDASGRDLGDAILAVDTRDRTDIVVDWTGSTIQSNERVYAVRLQYRIGDLGPFQDAVDSAGNVVEYLRSEIDGHARQFESLLASAVENQPYVQLRWRYYHVSGDSGPRAMLGISEVRVRGRSTGTSYEVELPRAGESSLGQNAPNPFTSATEIRFDLGSDGHVRLAVYDLLGRRLVTLIDAWMPAGEHSVELEAREFASGTYIYRIESADHSEARTMTVVR